MSWTKFLSIWLLPLVIYLNFFIKIRIVWIILYFTILSLFTNIFSDFFQTTSTTSRSTPSLDDLFTEDSSNYYSSTESEIVERSFSSSGMYSTVWKKQKFTLDEKIFRECWLLLSKNFCEKNVRVISPHFHTFHSEKNLKIHLVGL